MVVLRITHDSSPGRQLSDFKLLSELGRGAHGVVHKVRSKKTTVCT